MKYQVTDFDDQHLSDIIKTSASVINVRKGCQEKKSSHILFFSQTSLGPCPPSLVFFAGKYFSSHFFMKMNTIAETNFTHGPKQKNRLTPVHYCPELVPFMHSQAVSMAKDR